MHYTFVALVGLFLRETDERSTVHRVSVDAMQIYLDRLPTLSHYEKLNAAVVGYQSHPAHLDVYYVDPEDIIMAQEAQLSGSAARINPQPFARTGTAFFHAQPQMGEREKRHPLPEET